MKKRILSIFIAMVMLFSMIAVTAASECEHEFYEDSRWCDKCFSLIPCLPGECVPLEWAPCLCERCWYSFCINTDPDSCQCDLCGSTRWCESAQGLCMCDFCGNMLWDEYPNLCAGDACMCDTCGDVLWDKYPDSCVGDTCVCDTCGMIVWPERCDIPSGRCSCNICGSTSHTFSGDTCTVCGYEWWDDWGWGMMAGGEEGGGGFGDVTGTGAISIDDALEILKYLAGLDSVIATDPKAFNASRITGDVAPTISDALEILKYLAGMNDELVHYRWYYGSGGGGGWGAK